MFRVGCAVLSAVVLLSIGYAAEKKEDAQPAAPSEKRVETVYALGPGIVPPKLTRQVSPTYSGKGVGASGGVLVELVVSAQGLPEKVRIVRGLDSDTNQSTVDAVKQWRFKPALKENVPVAVRLTVEVSFRDI